jgi:polar amino acid transport system permease protein
VVDRRAEREAARRRNARRGQAIAVASTVAVVAILATVLFTSPGWPVVRDSFFNWTEFKETFPDIAKAFWLDIRVFVIVEIVVLVAGLGIALLRLARSPALFPLRIAAVAYTDVFRGVPVILLVYLIGFGTPALANSTDESGNAPLDWLPTEPVVLGGIALALCYSAYVAEVYRAGIASIHRGQRDAALAVGLTERQALRHVIVPQAVRRVGPPLLNDFISLQKDVALIAVIGVTGEAFRVAQVAASTDFNYTPLVGAALLYLLITIPLARLVDRYGIGGTTH